jgi:ribosome-binding factor A
MKTFPRADRVGGQIQKLLTEVLRRRTKDPRLVAATITGVEMTRDLRIARVYFTISGGEKYREASLQGFQSARGYLKRTLAAELGLRYMPDLVFYYDESFDYGDHIDRLLKSIHTDNGSNRSTLDT